MFEPYERYKDSGVEWLGEIPSHWRVSKIKSAFDVTLGKMLCNNPGSSSDTLEPYLKSVNIRWEGADTEKISEMWFSAEEKQKLLLRKNDLLITEGGDIGRCSIWNEEITHCYIQNAVNRVRSKGHDYTRYLYYWMYHLKHSGLTDALCNKLTIAHYTAEKVNQTDAILPPGEEQERIVNYLDHKTALIDQAITELERQRALLEEQKRVRIHELMTKGLDPNVPMKDSGVESFQKIPSHWNLSKLGSVAQVILGQSVPGETVDDEIEGVPFIQGCAEFGEIHPIIKKYTSAPNKLCQKGDVIISVRAPVGEINVADQTICLGRGVSSIRHKNRYYMYFLTAYVSYLRSNEKGTTFKAVTGSDIKNLLVTMPPESEQEEIVNRLDSLTSEIGITAHAISQKIATLKEYRKTLIHEVVTGKVKVSF